MAQAPTINIATPSSGANYTKDQPVAVSYSCTGADTCVGTAADGSALPVGAMLNTTTIGPSYITVTATNASGSSSQQATYNVVEKDDGGAGGQTPATLTLDLTAASAFSPFIPGVDRAYTTTATARVVSTALDATLSVADAATTDTGHLVNGTFALPQVLQIGAAKPDANGTTPPPATFANVGGSASPTMLLTYDGPVVETDTLTFKQTIGSTEALRTGAYSKTLTFTLSTMNP
jgi:hypothetical protein